MSVLAFAGRRVDADGAPRRFPADLVPIVRERIRALLVDRGATAVVGSAACGADLLALGAAGELGLRRRVILPFAPDRFRETSVIDRPGDWGAAYDRVIAAVGGTNDLAVLESASEGDDAYARTNFAILNHAQALAAEAAARSNVFAVIVWDGASRGPDDLTAQFADEARRRGLKVLELSTL